MTTESFKVGEWRVNPTDGSIEGRDSRHTLRPKTMAILDCLAAFPGQVLSRDQIIETVWGRALISDEPLTSSIAELRRRLGDDPREPRYIQTIPKRGYRLVAEVQRAAEPFAAKGLARSSVGPGTDNLLGKPSFAILPFDNRSQDPKHGYYGEAVSEDIITELARFDEIVVVARNSSFMFSSRDDVKEVGEKLEVSYVMQGSIQQSGVTLRVTAQVIDVATRTHIWAESYTYAVADMLEVQHQITTSIVGAMLGRLEKVIAENAAGGTENLTAYDHFLRGCYLIKRLDIDQVMEAKTHFESAIALDENFAAAYGRLAGVHAALAIVWDTREDVSVIQQHVDRALQLNPNENFAHLVLAFMLLLRGAFDSAEQQFDAALSFHPRHSELMAWAAQGMTFLGRRDEARALIAEAKRRNPLPHDYHHLIRSRLEYADQNYQAAIDAVQHSPGYEVRTGDLATLAAAFAQLSRIDEARTHGAKALERARKQFGLETEVEQKALFASRVTRYRLEADRAHLEEGYRKAGLL